MEHAAARPDGRRARRDAESLDPDRVLDRMAQIDRRGSGRARERAWIAVSESARDLAMLREPQHVLDAIVERGRRLLGGDISWLAGPARDGDDDELVVLAIDGVSTEWARQMRAARGRGAAGYIQRTRAPFSTADYFADERLRHDPKIDAILRREGILSMVAVPLLSGGAFLGVLVVADRQTREYTHSEIATLSTLASHAAVAVRNAQAFDETRVALAQAEQANAMLELKREALELAAEAHERMTRLVAQGGGPEDVCRTLASLLGGSVWLIDALDAVRCTAGGPGDSDAPPLASLASPAQLRQALDASRATGRSVAIDTAAGGECRVTAVVGGSQLLGALVARADAPLTDTAVRTLERSALVLAVTLLSADRAGGAGIRPRDALLVDLLNPLRAGSAALARAVAESGLPDGGPMVLALLAPARVDASIVVRRLRGAPSRAATLIAELDGQVVVLVFDGEADDVARWLRDALSGTARAAASGVVSTPAAGIAMLAATFERLRRRAALAGAVGAVGALRTERELAPYAAAFDARTPAGTEAVGGFVDATIGRLLAHDRARDARLAPSLLAYLDHGFNTKAAAVALGVHVNTLSKRLEAAAALTGGWSVPGRGLDLQLALRLAALGATDVSRA